MEKAKFNKSGFALQRFETLVHGFTENTGEFTESYVTVIPEGCGIPACTTMAAPPDGKEGHALVFDRSKNQWDYIEDNRGKVYYTKAEGRPAVLEGLGSAPDSVTEIPRPSNYHCWCHDSGCWHNDGAAELADKVAEATERKQQLMSKANFEVMALGYGQDLRGLSADEYKRLTALKRYVFDLYKLDVSDPDNIIWPADV